MRSASFEKQRSDWPNGSARLDMSEGWRETRLGDIVSINPEAVDIRFDREIQYIDLSAVSATGGINRSAVTRLLLSAAPGRARRITRADDVLVATVRPYLRGFAAVPGDLDGAVASTGFAVLRAIPEVAIPGFVWLLVTTDAFVEGLMRRATGSNYPAVRPADVAEQPVVLPPLAQQRRIVDVVGAIDKFALAAADNAARAADLRSALREVLVDVDSVTRRLDEVVAGIEGGVSPVTEGRPPLGGERSVLKLSAVRAGKFVPTEAKAVALDVKLPQRAMVREGDVLITRSNTPETVGMVCFVESAPDNLYLSDLTLRLHPRDGVDPAFLAEALNTRSVRREIVSSAKGTSGSMRKISRETLRRIEIRLPAALEGQIRIAAILRAASDVATASERLQRQLRSLRAELARDLLSGSRTMEASYDRFLDGAA
jgi:type I restriction enzyme S subunit